MTEKQTATEWLIDKIEEHFCLLPVDLIEQANKMFEQQIIDAWFDGVTNCDSEKEAEQYYNETFKSE